MHHPVLLAVLIVFMAACAAGAICCGRLANWHRKEAGYWGWGADHARALDHQEALDLVRWAVQEENPSIRTRLRPWRPPHERREQS